MSLVGIFFQQRPSIQLSGVDSAPLFFDGTLEETTEQTTEVTQFPVETGAIGNDHAVTQPLTILMRVGISDNVFRAATANLGDVGDPVARIVSGVGAGLGVGQLSGAAAAVAGLAAGGVSAAYQAGQAATRSQAALDAVRSIQRANALVDVVGTKRRYENCVISSTRQTTDKENEGGLILEVEFTQLLLISDSPVGQLAPGAGTDLETQGQPAQDIGLLVPR